MADGGHFGFDDTRIVAKIMDKHLIDFSFIFQVQVRTYYSGELLFLSRVELKNTLSGNY